MSVKGGVEVCSLLKMSSIVTGTWTDLKKRGYLLLCLRAYLVSHAFTTIWQILLGESHWLQSNQQKQDKIFSFFLAWDRTQALSVLSLLPCHLV